MLTLSVVIPTRNEALWLPRTLGALANSKLPSEIIVVDNYSEDATRVIATTAGCSVLNGGLPAFARNFGMAASTGDIVLFLDADVVISADAITEAAAAISAGAGCVVFRHVPIGSRTASVAFRFLHHAAEILALINIHVGIGSALMVRRDCFAAIGGFNEDLTAGEDIDLILRISRIAKTTYQGNFPVYVSARRFRAENPIGYLCKVLLWTVLRIARIPLDIIPYSWPRYTAGTRNKEIAIEPHRKSDRPRRTPDI
ncbi:MAG: glycosyltransferase [Pseudomonadota bacterium]|jgi:glycosyltransferase involved in cell wall biosynthesis